MKARSCSSPLLFILHIIPCLLAVFSASAQGTAFTYQGRLNDGSNTANGSYDLLFKLYPASNSGSPTGGITLTNSATAVSNGLFTTTLDFGSNILNGTSQWLEIGVRSNGTSSFNTLSPRQQLTPAPYAIFAAKAATATAATTLSGVVPGASLSGSYGSAVTFNNSTNMFSGTFTGNGAGPTNLSKTLTNPAFFDAAPKASYVLVTNRTMLLPSNPGQTNGLCLYSIIDPSVSVLSSIGFLDPSGPRFAGINWFPNHTGSEMEMTIDCPGSTAIGWAQETIPGIVLQPNRSLQIGITSGYGRLEAIYIQGVYTSYAAPNMGYSIPLSFNSAYTSNGISMNQLMTLWAHATNTNGESRLTLYDNWDQAATPDLKSHDFSKSVIRAEFITASNGGSGGVLLNGIVLATNLVVGDGFFSRSLTLMANSNTPTLFDLKMNAMNASTFCVVSNVNAAGTYVVAAFSMEDDSGNHTGLATYGGQPMTLLSHNATYLSGSAYQMLDVFGLPGAIGTANVAYTNNLATAPYAISGGALTIINVASVGASSPQGPPTP